MNTEDVAEPVRVGMAPFEGNRLDLSMGGCEQP